MAQANRWGNGSSAQISHSWGQDPAESAGDSSLIAPWLDDGPETGPSRQATLEPRFAADDVAPAEHWIHIALQVCSTDRACHVGVRYPRPSRAYGARGGQSQHLEETERDPAGSAEAEDKPGKRATWVGWRRLRIVLYVFAVDSHSRGSIQLDAEYLATLASNELPCPKEES
ncbi:hypothetical protein FRC12_019045 [Ceratobasidium sp. 428]|nr:hypothetical protein FRC12_019045 [Ceratobasidium sp. 428]